MPRVTASIDTFLKSSTAQEGMESAITDAASFRAVIGVEEAGIFQAVANIDPAAILVHDLFAESTAANVAAAGTRAANPGPGTATVQALAGVSEARFGRGLMTLTHRPPSGSNSLVRWDGVTAAAGLTMIVRVIPSMGGSVGYDFFGFSPSSTSHQLRGGGIQLGHSGSESDNVGIYCSTLSTSTDDTVSSGYGDGGAELGEEIALAIRYVSLTQREYWFQRNGWFGCDVGSDNWAYLGADSAGVAIAGTVYPTISHQWYGLLTVREVMVLSEWTPNPRHGAWDWTTGKVGIHVPAIERDPVSGLLVGAWNNGTTHVNSDTMVRGAVRLADGTWTAAQTLIAAPGGGQGIHIGSLHAWDGQFWLTHWRAATVTDGGTLYKRELTIDAETGAISVGAETSLGITGTQNLALAPSITLASGRILLPYHNGDGSPLTSRVARSDDGGATWTSSTVAASMPGGTTSLVEPTLVTETDGSVACYMRSTAGYLYYSRSTDNGETWSTPVGKPQLPSPGSRAMARKFANGDVWISGNDHKTQRRAITLWRIGDGGGVLEKVRLGDFAASMANSQLQYPAFVEDGSDITLLTSYGFLNSTGSAMLRDTVRWVRPVALESGGTGIQGAPPAGQYETTRGARQHVGPTGRNAYLHAGATGTITSNCRHADVFLVRMTGNVTLAAPLAPMDWQRCAWVFTQDATGSRTLTLNSIFKPGPFTVTLSTAASATDYLEAIYNPHEGEWHVVNFQTGY